MRIETVKYGITVNLGNYENQRIELEACVEDGESWEKVMAQVRTKVHSLSESKQKLDEREKHLEQLKQCYFKTKRIVKEMQMKWEIAKSVCGAHGIKLADEDLPEIPSVEKEEELFGVLTELEAAF